MDDTQIPLDTQQSVAGLTRWAWSMKLLFRVPAELRALAKALHIHAGAGRWTELTASRIHGLIDGIVERLAKLESEEKGDDMNRFVDKIDADAAAPELRGDIDRIDAETDGVGLHANAGVGGVRRV